MSAAELRHQAATCGAQDPATWIFLKEIVGHRRFDTMSLTILLLLFGFCVAVACMFLCACVNPSSPTFMGRLARAVTQELPSNIDWIIRKIPIVGPGLLDGSAWLFNYCVFRPNPILQIVYGTLVLGGYGLVLYEAYPQIPNDYMGGWHRYTGVLAVFFTMWSWYKACTVEPGYITSENWRDYDNYSVFKGMYDPGKYYRYEDGRPAVPRLPRSKHDAFTDKVVSRFDHFCPWLNNPVGERNYKWFILFLAATTFMLGYGSFATASVVLTYANRKNLFKARYMNKKTGQVMQASKSMVLQYLLHMQSHMMMLLFLCGIMCVVVFFFFTYHLYLTSQNRTTNEGFKWSSYQAWWEDKEIARLKRLHIENAKNDNDTSDSEDVKRDRQKRAARAAAKQRKSSRCKIISSGFWEYYLHGIYLTTCGCCGLHIKDSRAISSARNSGYEIRPCPKYPYRLPSFRENLMEVFYPRSTLSVVSDKMKRKNWEASGAPKPPDADKAPASATVKKRHPKDQKGGNSDVKAKKQ